MTIRIRYLPIEEVVSGMVLGAPLNVGEQGVTTFSLPAGHLLTDSNMAQIAQRNAEWACIKVEDPRNDEERAADLRTIRDQLNLAFVRANRSQPAISALYDAILRYRSL